MIRIPLYVIPIIALSLLTSCATSMSPLQFNESFPNTTESTFYDRASANEAISNGKCKLQAEYRKYTAPIGFLVSDDVRNGADGVDQWVQIDGGNAYRIINFEWVPVGDQGVTQLIIYFDTMLCE